MEKHKPSVLLTFTSTADLDDFHLICDQKTEDKALAALGRILKASARRRLRLHVDVAREGQA